MLKPRECYPNIMVLGLSQQRRRISFLETLLNTAIGFGVALLSQFAVFPLFDIYVPLETNLWIGFWFTVISIVRGYLVRRLFVWLHNERILT